MYLLYFLFLVLLASNCSSNTDVGLRAEKIVGGTLARRGEFKFVVAVMYKSIGLPDQNPCSAGILGDWFVATVAHCFSDKTYGGWRRRLFYIVSGVYKLKQQLSGARKIGVDTITVPSIYNPNEPDSYRTEGNLAVIKLNESLELRPHHPLLASLRLPAHQIDYNETYYIAAYGYYTVGLITEEINGIIHSTYVGGTDCRLRYAKVNLITTLDCFFELSERVAPGNMCAKAVRPEPNKKTGICKFDSGAPLHHNGYLDGLAINGFPSCDEEFLPGIYIDVFNYSTFINNVLQDVITHDMRVFKLEEAPRGHFTFREVELRA